MATSIRLTTAAKAATTSGIGPSLVESKGRRASAIRFRRAIASLEVIVDLVTVTLSVVAGYWFYYNLELGKHIQYPLRAVVGLAFGFAMVVVLMLDRVGAYKRGNGLLRIRETEQVLRVSMEAFLIAFAVSFFTSVLVSRWLLIISVTLVPL